MSTFSYQYLTKYSYCPIIFLKITKLNKNNVEVSKFDINVDSNKKIQLDDLFEKGSGRWWGTKSKKRTVSRCKIFAKEGVTGLAKSWKI